MSRAPGRILGHIGSPALRATINHTAISAKRTRRYGIRQIDHRQWFCHAAAVPSDLAVFRFNQRTGETAIVRNWMRSNLLHLRRSRRDDAVGLRLGWQRDDSIPIVFVERPDQNESAACDPTRPAARTRLKMAGDHRWSEGVWLDRHRCRPGPAIARRVWRRADGCKIPARSA
jgi:hypothetical protein